MLSIIHSAALLGIDAYAVNVEVDLSSGLPAFDIVGLPDSAVKESRERVRTAIKNTGLSLSNQTHHCQFSAGGHEKRRGVL